jgi:hypothetical protein
VKNRSIDTTKQLSAYQAIALLLSWIDEWEPVFICHPMWDTHRRLIEDRLDKLKKPVKPYAPKKKETTPFHREPLKFEPF